MIDIDIESAKKFLSYNAKTGVISWIKSTTKSVKIGDSAGTVHNTGYIQIKLQGVQMRAHRLAWAMHYGVQPKEIDHINGIRDDNRIDNLRECTTSENHSNKTAYKNSKSGIKGVSWSKSSKKWYATISKNGEIINLGLHKNIEDAAIAYANAAKIHHGEFMRLSA